MAALDVASTYHSEAMLNHGIRSYLWAAELARVERLEVDDELLFVSAVLHDIGIESSFDNRTLSFEYAGGEVAWVFGAGAGWTRDRRRRAAEIIVRHMEDDVSAVDDPEGYLLCEATGLDISGRGVERWSEEYRALVVAGFPRPPLPEEFVGCFEVQAAAKPDSSPGVALAGGLAARLAANPLDGAAPGR
ncbi:cyanamide hydratase [Herbiconiux sp. A18JL235]|uniref:Cyanamide hydratase n=1 Tax=Herbiconiux sp. A18JL235 TaxID=3152363 RepID=A0AB39BJH6_9MICO